MTEDALLTWIAAREAEGEEGGEREDSPKLKLFRQPQVQAFVAWLQEDEESEEEDEEDEEDD